MGEKNADSVVIDYTKVTQPIRVVRSGKMLTVMVNWKEILKTRNACIVHEPGYKPIYYFPFSDFSDGKLKATSTVSNCLYECMAHYYFLVAGNRKIKDSVWRYSEPKKEFTPIKDYIAFYENAIEGVEESG
ncbi:MAG: DUF427 domain-containing protein [Candidatus Thermoplasmatota archaeon]|jgi:uncharacterized protein (DUF427 family)|nr:DUF427 domain-containing protein [Candidatus Thermoplasmatota archaeon]